MVSLRLFSTWDLLFTLSTHIDPDSLQILLSGSTDLRGEHIIMLSPKFQLPDFGL